MTVELVCVPPDRIKEIWPLAKGLIYTAMKRGSFSSFKPVENSLLDGHALLWLAVKESQVLAAMVTELHQTEWRKVCVIVALGGESMDSWLHFTDRIEGFAKAESCSAIRIIGRKGWSKVLGDYRVKQVVLEKELEL